MLLESAHRVHDTVLSAAQSLQICGYHFGRSPVLGSEREERIRCPALNEPLTEQVLGVKLPYFGAVSEPFQSHRTSDALTRERSPDSGVQNTVLLRHLSHVER